ncbi:DELLA protein RGL1-like [Aristolochia californica]|uniref:DELLA protein RGL1-like n=1 Tax=Aristolochia californica TaxID=171875 RepID=UPI0035D99CA3
MSNSLVSFDPFNFQGALDAYSYSSLGGLQREESGQGKRTHFMETPEWAEVDHLWSACGFNQDNLFEKGMLPSKDQQVYPEFILADEIQFDMISPEAQSIHEPETLKSDPSFTQNSVIAEPWEILEPKKEKSNSIFLASLELLNNYRTAQQRFKISRENMKESSIPVASPVTAGGGELSTEDVMRVAGAHYIQTSVKDDDLSMLRHPFGTSLAGLTEEEIKDVELAQLLLASAEKVGNQQFDRASRLLTQCYYLSSDVGNPVQRVVYYFADALRERIDRETGRISWKDLEGRGKWGEDIEDLMNDPHPALLACHQSLPFSLTMQCTEIQAILDSVATSRKIHLVDLAIRIGVQWTLLMQALADRVTYPVKLLKISAVGASREKIARTGKRLISFSQTFNLPFVFKEVFVSDMKDLKEDMFEVEAEESVVVYASTVLSTMMVRPESLENTMRVIRSLKPCLMVVTEVEANHNSLSFNNRFIESLFFFSAWFDCLDTCMDRNDPNRMSVEADFLSKGICSMVATEGSERIIRHVGIDVWRSFFSRYGFMEVEMNQMYLYQAELIVKKFPTCSSCTIDVNGKSLIISWKGTPLHFISAWKRR